MSLALALALLASPAAVEVEERADRLAAHVLAVRGPLAAVELEVPGAGTAELEGPWPAGASERAELFLPRPARGALADVAGIELRAVAAGGVARPAGQALLEAAPEQDRARRERFEALPRMLRARAPLAPPDVRPEPPAAAALLLVGALAAVGWQLRRRGPATLAVGLVGGAAVFLLARAPASPPSSSLVVEVQGPEGRLLVVESARGRLRLGDPAGLLRLESRPPGAALHLRTEGRAGALEVAAAGTELHAFREAPALSVSRASNGAFDLEAAWLRPAGAQGWVALGPWPAGAPLPAAPPESGQELAARLDPPGWLVGGLPQGPAVVVGGGERRWLRWIDAPPPQGPPPPGPPDQNGRSGR